jgi:dTDP-4-amino-4,6-dideoxygalactose transaminase
VVNRVPLVDLAGQEAMVADDVLEAIGRVAQGSRFILGPHVEAFESWLARECGVRHAVGVACGTDALELALRALGVGAGDAVITPALSFIAAAEAIANAGARPVFCDVDPETMNASERTVGDALVRARRAGMRVRAVLPVDLFGLAVPASLRTLAEGEGIALVEDAAQAIGGRDENGSPCGAAADAGCFSFFPSKNLGAWGDGGAVVTDRDDVAARVRRLRAHGAVTPYVHTELGRNSRLDALQAAVLLAKAPRLPSWQATRRRLAERYCAELTGLPVTLPVTPEAPAVHAWHAFVLRTPKRDTLSAALRDEGIESRVYYPVPLHRQEAFAWLNEPALPVAEAACRNALAIPLFVTMTDTAQGVVIDAIKRVLSA